MQVHGNKGRPRPPGSGRAKGTHNKYNNIFEEAFKRTLTPEIADELCLSAYEHFKKGHPGLLHTIAPYGLRELPKAVEVAGPDGGPVQSAIDLSTSDKDTLKALIEALSKRGHA